MHALGTVVRMLLGIPASMLECLSSFLLHGLFQLPANMCLARQQVMA